MPLFVILIKDKDQRAKRALSKALKTLKEEPADRRDSPSRKKIPRGSKKSNLKGVTIHMEAM